MDSKKTSTDYYLTFKEKNKEKVSQKHACELCGGQFTYFNKSNHLVSKRHLRAVEVIERYKEKNIKQEETPKEYIDDVNQYIGISL